MSLAEALGVPTPSKPSNPPPPFEDVETDGDPHGEEENAEEEGEQANEDDLFGGSEAGFESPPPEDGLTSPERRKRKALEYDEDDQDDPQDIIPLREENVQIPNIPVPKSSDGDYWVLRMSNFVKLDPKPFHPDTYVGPEHDDEEGSQMDTIKERSMFIKLEVENTVRWRWVKDEDGNNHKQSNSRIIRWSDGSLSLLLGKELFDINQTVDISALAPRSALGGSSQSQLQSQSQNSSLTASRMRSAGLTYLVAQHKRAEVLQSEKVITGHFTLRPTSMQSETHRKLVRAVGQKHNKVARLKMAPSELVQKDPEGELAELAKSIAKAKPKRQSRRAEDPFFKKKRKSRDFDAKLDEEEEEEAYESDESDLKGKKKKRASGEDAKRGIGEYQTTDGFVVSDEEDESGQLGKKGRRDDEEETKDALDEAEEKLEQAARKRKSGKKDELEEEEEEEEDNKMDVESEEEEEEEEEKEEEEEEDFGARKSHGKGRKRIAVEDEDEE